MKKHLVLHKCILLLLLPFFPFQSLYLLFLGLLHWLEPKVQCQTEVKIAGISDLPLRLCLLCVRLRLPLSD